MRPACSTVAEDSGLEVDALGGAPGVESARFGGRHTSYAHKFTLIYDRLRACPAALSTARFICALALVEGDAVLFETQGAVEGRIAPEPKGDGRIRLRSDLLLSAVRMHAGGSRRSQVGGQPPGSCFSRAPRLLQADPDAVTVRVFGGARLPDLR